MKNTANLIQVIPLVRANLVYFGIKYSPSTATKYIALNFTSVILQTRNQNSRRK